MEDIGKRQKNPKIILMIDFDKTFFKTSLYNELLNLYEISFNKEEVEKSWREECKPIVEGSFNISKEDFQKILGESKEADIRICIVSQTPFVPQVQSLMDEFFRGDIKVFGSGDFLRKGEADIKNKNDIIKEAIKDSNVENRPNYNPVAFLIDDSENNVRECSELKNVRGFVFKPEKSDLKSLMEHVISISKEKKGEEKEVDLEFECEWIYVINENNKREMCLVSADPEFFKNITSSFRKKDNKLCDEEGKEVFDGKGNPVDCYSEEEVREIISLVPSSIEGTGKPLILEEAGDTCCPQPASSGKDILS
jgi:hypothetical protein